MRVYVTYCLALVLGVFLVLALLDVQEARRHNAALADTARVAAEQATIWQARYAEEASSVKVKTVHVTKWATRYDTLRLALRDSVPGEGTTVPTLGTVLEAADSTIAACRSLVVSTRGALTACDSAQSALRVERDAYKTLWEKERPSKFDKVKPWLMGAAGLYVGLKLRGP